MPTLFISEDKFKELTAVNGNIDAEKIRPIILKAQDKHIHPILGTDLYDSIKSKIEGDTLSGNYATLVNTYIQPVLAHLTLVEGLPFWSAEIRNGGIYRRQAENASALTKEEYANLINKAKEDVHFYKQRLLDYLCFNNELFSEYSTNTDEDISPQNSNYNSYIYLD